MRSCKRLKNINSVSGQLGERQRTAASVSFRWLHRPTRRALSKLQLHYASLCPVLHTRCAETAPASLFGHRPAEFGAPIGRVGTRFRADDIALVQVARCLVPVCFGPIGEFVPRAAQPLVGAVIDGAYHLERWTLPRLYTADGRDGRRHRHADVQIESLWCQLEVMRKPRSDRTDALRLHSGHSLADGRSHDVLHLRAWRLNVKCGDQLRGRLDNLRRFNHVPSPMNVGNNVSSRS